MVENGKNPRVAMRGSLCSGAFAKILGKTAFSKIVEKRLNLQ